VLVPVHARETRCILIGHDRSLTTVRLFGLPVQLSVTVTEIGQMFLLTFFASERARVRRTFGHMFPPYFVEHSLLNKATIAYFAFFDIDRIL
jgi:hypothetical protein